MDVAAWLKNLGLGKYERTFREHDVDADVVSELGDADLEKLGVSLGLSQAAAEGDRRTARRFGRICQCGHAA